MACSADGATDITATQHSMEGCEVWASLSLREREKLVKCVKHPFKDDHSTQNCTVNSKNCKFCDKDSHHFLLCPKKSFKSLTNVTSSSHKVVTTQILPPVLVQAQFIDWVENSKIGTLMDLCSTDDYVTHRYARRKGFPCEDVDLIIEGVGGKQSRYRTKVYQVPIFDKDGKQYIIPCFGLNKISSVAPPPKKDSYKGMCEKFGIKPYQVKRPQSIDLLLSMRHNFLHPKPVLSNNGMVLYSGPLGMVFGGSNPDLTFTPFKGSYPSSVHVLHKSDVSVVRRSNVLITIVKRAVHTASVKKFEMDSFGVDCNPYCLGCKVGKCAIKSKPVSARNRSLSVGIDDRTQCLPKFAELPKTLDKTLAGITKDQDEAKQAPK